jgi:hypothetical protein
MGCIPTATATAKASTKAAAADYDKPGQPKKPTVRKNEDIEDVSVLPDKPSIVRIENEQDRVFYVAMVKQFGFEEVENKARLCISIGLQPWPSNISKMFSEDKLNAVNQAALEAQNQAAKAAELLAQENQQRIDTSRKFFENLASSQKEELEMEFAAYAEAKNQPLYQSILAHGLKEVKWVECTFFKWLADKLDLEE